MTRRQLVQSLALAAAGVPVAYAVAQGMVAPVVPVISSSAAAPFSTVWLDHISFQSADYKKSVEFYTSLMGWTVKPGSDNGRQATLDINGIGGIIIRNGRGGRGNASAGGSAASGTVPVDTTARSAMATRPPVTGVIDHISWGVDNWDNARVKAELESRGLKPSKDSGGEPDMETSKFKSYHVRDPDGWDLQISNQTPKSHNG